MGRDSIGPPAVVHYLINHEVLGELKYRHLKEHEAIEYAVYCRIGRPHKLDEEHYDIIQGYVIDRGISEGTSRLRRLIATGKLSENDIRKYKTLSTMLKRTHMNRSCSKPKEVLWL
ncbi:hypothetical protein [Methanococcus maripaludis]|uniref:Uncharacterized protein n=3 Tax=Methanococcus maripaludis TaxID=39152 RepID=A0A7J9PGK4_METMI|nr:hypothetical protein [Methanococcus maripaludis]MBA2861837.1 hypothetical protein [Methanococcus maripaludis]